MNGLRIAAAVVVWITVAGGLLLGTLWFVFGGGRAAGPEDESVALTGETNGRSDTRRPTSFSTAQVVVHGMLGVLTAALVSYAVARDDGVSGYIVTLLALAGTAAVGGVMFERWHSGERPRLGRGAVDSPARVEDRLPKVVVYAHGAAALTTIALVVALIAVG